MSGPARIFTAYLDAFTRGDIDGAAALLADDFSFAGPMQQTEGKEAFLDGARHLAPLARGHTMLRQWEDGDEVCSIYVFAVETPAGAGSVIMSEWSRVREGRVASSRLIFDTAAFVALMP